MKINQYTIPRIAIAFFISIQIFSYTLSFLNLIYGIDTWQNFIVDIIYKIRNISFYVTIISIILYNKITFEDLILMSLFLFSYLFMILIFPDNMEYFKNVQPLIKFSICVFMAISSKMLNFDELKKILKWESRVIVICLLLTIQINIDFMNQNIVYMEYANAISIGIALLLYYSIFDSSIIDFVLSIIGLISLLLYGSRGSLVTLLALLIIFLWLKIRNKKILILGCIFLFVFTLFGPMFVSTIITKMINLGIDSRTIEKLINGNLFKSNDRIMIYEYLISIILKKPILGTGICGDRYFLPLRFTGTDATYAHNLFIEILVDYGLIIGSLLILLLLYIIIKFLFKEIDISRKAFFYVFFIIGFIQLMISRSWITEPNFFIFFSILLTYSTNKRIQYVIKGNSSLRKYQIKDEVIKCNH